MRVRCRSLETAPIETVRPPDASPVDGDVIRFVRGEPPNADDMKTWADDGRAGDDACMACALSVLRRLEDVPAARKAIPFFRKRIVAKARLDGAFGLIKQTGKHAWHFSLWVEAAKRSSLHESVSLVAA